MKFRPMTISISSSAIKADYIVTIKSNLHRSLPNTNLGPEHPVVKILANAVQIRGCHEVFPYLDRDTSIVPVEVDYPDYRGYDFELRFTLYYFDKDFDTSFASNFMFFEDAILDYQKMFSETLQKYYEFYLISNDIAYAQKGVTQ